MPRVEVVITSVTPGKMAKTKNGPKQKWVIQGGGLIFNTWDAGWQAYVGKLTPLEYTISDFGNDVGDVKTVLGIPPKGAPAMPVVPTQINGADKFAILDKKLDAILDILHTHFKT